MPSTRCCASACDDTSIATVRDARRRASGRAAPGARGLRRRAVERDVLAVDAGRPSCRRRPTRSPAARGDRLEEVRRRGLAVRAGDAEAAQRPGRVAVQGAPRGPSAARTSGDPGLATPRSSARSTSSATAPAVDRLRRRGSCPSVARTGHAREQAAGPRAAVVHVIAVTSTSRVAAAAQDVDAAEEVVQLHGRGLSLLDGVEEDLRVPGAVRGRSALRVGVRRHARSSREGVCMMRENDRRRHLPAEKLRACGSSKTTIAARRGRSRARSRRTTRCSGTAACRTAACAPSRLARDAVARDAAFVPVPSATTPCEHRAHRARRSRATRRGASPRVGSSRRVPSRADRRRDEPGLARRRRRWRSSCTRRASASP